MSGWYKQQRNLSERPWFRNSQMVHLYHYLKERAYVTQGMYEGKIIRRGSCPVTRSEMSEMTGMSLRTIDRVLRSLIDCGEIIVNGNNRFSVVTVCDYDTYEAAESLFGSTDGTAAGTTDGTAAGTAHLLTIEGRRKKEEESLTRTFSPYKTERETRDVALEVKKLYNKTFDGVLRRWDRLSAEMRIKVDTCISRFGRQSVDIVFDQVKHEKFSMGDNDTGFIADFAFIFKLKNYEAYLGRSELRKKKKSAQLQPQPQQVEVHSEPQPTREDRLEKCRRRYQDMIALCEENPKSSCYTALMTAYQNGDLQKLGISWIPNQN